MAQNRSPSSGNRGHVPPERPVTFNRNQRSGWSGILNKPRVNLTGREGLGALILSHSHKVRPSASFGRLWLRCLFSNINKGSPHIAGSRPSERRRTSVRRGINTDHAPLMDCGRGKTYQKPMNSRLRFAPAAGSSAEMSTHVDKGASFDCRGSNGQPKL